VNTPILDILRLSVTDQGGRGTPWPAPDHVDDL